MTADTYREHLNDLQVEIEELRAKLNEAQTGDLISRQAAIDALVYENIIDHMDTVYDSELHRCKRAIERILSQLPSTQPEQRWIPVTERLPERYGWYLCTLKDGRVNCYYWNKKGEWVDNGKKHFFDLYNIRSRYTGEEINPEQEGSVYWTDWVIAWMPLPEPWEEEE